MELTFVKKIKTELHKLANGRQIHTFNTNRKTTTKNEK